MNGPKDITLRNDLRPGDIGYLTLIQGRVYFEEYGFNSEYEAYVAHLFYDLTRDDTDRKRIWIVEMAGEIMGCVALFRKTDEQAQLRLLFVHPDARGKGIGSMLVNEVISFARECGYSSIFLLTEDVLKDAAGIYEKAGFRLTWDEEEEKWGVRFRRQRYEMDLR